MTHLLCIGQSVFQPADSPNFPSLNTVRIFVFTFLEYGGLNHQIFFSINATKYIIHTNIDKIMEIKMIKNIQTSTNTREQKLLLSLTYSSNNKNTEKYKKYSRTSSES